MRFGKGDSRSWNVVAVARDGLTGAALEALKTVGEFRTAGYPRVLVGEVAPEGGLVETVAGCVAANPPLARTLHRVVPVEDAVLFDGDDVTETLCERFEGMGERIAARSFHVRVHLRGLKGRLETPAVELALGGFLYDRAEALGRPPSVSFDDPDVVVAVEVVGRRVGYGFLEREQRALPLIWRA